MAHSSRQAPCNTRRRRVSVACGPVQSGLDGFHPQALYLRSQLMGSYVSTPNKQTYSSAFPFNGHIGTPTGRSQAKRAPYMSCLKRTISVSADLPIYPVLRPVGFWEPIRLAYFSHQRTGPKGGKFLSTVFPIPLQCHITVQSSLTFCIPMFNIMMVVSLK